MDIEADNDHGSEDGDDEASIHFLSVKPGFPHCDLDTITTLHKADNFTSALKTFIRRVHPPPAVPVLPNSVDRFDLYKRLSIRHKPVPATQNITVDRIRATPEVPAHERSKAVPAHFDTVLVRTEEVNEHTRGTYLEGLRVAQLRVIFTMPEHLRTQNIPKRLAYIEWFTPFRAPNNDSGFYSVTRSHQNRTPSAAIIPIDSIVSSCHLIPKFGTKFHPARWDSAEILEECTSFLLNKYISIATFYNYNKHLFVESS